MHSHVDAIVSAYMYTCIYTSMHPAYATVRLSVCLLVRRPTQIHVPTRVCVYIYIYIYIYMYTYGCVCVCVRACACAYVQSVCVLPVPVPLRMYTYVCVHELMHTCLVVSCALITCPPHSVLLPTPQVGR